MKKEKYIYFHYANTNNSSFIYRKLGMDMPTDIFYINDENVEYFYVPFFEYEYLKKYSKHTGVKNLKELEGSENNYFDAVIYFLKKKKGTIVVPASFPSWLLLKIIKAGMKIIVKDSYFFKESLYKTKEEIGIIRKTAKGVQDCFIYIEDILSVTTSKNNYVYYKGKKLSSKILSGMINSFLLSKNIKCDFTIVASGEYAYYPHCQIDHYLKIGKTIIIDLGARDLCSGYFVDVSRTYCLGIPDNKYFINLYNDIIEIKTRLEEMAKPGKLISETYREVVSIMFDHGIEMTTNGFSANGDSGPTCHHSLGHGVGREIHQLPIISGSAAVNFEENMILAFEPGAYIKNCGGVRIEDTYLVTKNGVENLTSGKYNFLIKPR